MVFGNYKPVVTEIKLQMENYAERRKRRKIILQQKIKCLVTNGNNQYKILIYLYIIEINIILTNTIIIVNFQYTSQCSPTFNDHNPTTSSQCTPSANITLSMNRCRHHSIGHTINVSFIQRNLMSSYDNKKNKATPSTSTCQPSDYRSNITCCDIHIGNFYCNVIVTYLHGHI